MDDLSRWTWARVKALNRRVNLSTEGWLNASHRCDAKKSKLCESLAHHTEILWWQFDVADILNVYADEESQPTHTGNTIWRREWRLEGECELTKMNEDEEENYFLPCLERKWDGWVRKKVHSILLASSPIIRQESTMAYKLKYWMKSRDDCGGALSCAVDMYIVK